jgi:acetoin utilization deacetylase AcuC-like enzyme
VAAPVYLSHPSSLDHDTGTHPERAARIAAVERELERAGWCGFDRVEAPAADVALVEAVHPPEHVEMIAALSARGGGMIDLDTLTSAGSYDAALHAAGGAAHMVDLLLGEGEERRPYGFVGTRPPGHHAEANRAMGFCLFNNVAVAARRALDAHGAGRVLILDWDVHHGNGTGAVFAPSPEVLFVSIHQSPLYPGTGAASDAGTGAGAGYNVNLPVPAGSGDETFCSLVEHLVVPLARSFAPGLILVSAGYDAHAEDPLAGCEVTDAGYATMTASMRRVADELGVPLGVVLEGGYDLSALARGVRATLETLSADEVAVPDLRVHGLAEAALERLSAGPGPASGLAGAVAPPPGAATSS